MLTQISALSACISAFVLGGSAIGQVGGVGGFGHVDPEPWIEPSCETFYVSPDVLFGDDNNSGTVYKPFLTINHAIWVASQAKPSVVVLMPGIYSGGTNGEWYPIAMEDDVSLQGFGATNTVLKSDGWSDVLLFQANGLDYSTTYVDSLTLTDGESGVSMVSEFDEVGPTISNCVMADNYFGVRMDTIWDHATGDYIRFFPRLINNTIAHNVIGIFDMGHFGPDDGKGVAEPAIVNCTVLFNSGFDLAGVDASDVSHTAFRSVDSNMLATGNQFPLTWAWIASMTAGNTFIDSYRFDYRQRPESLLVDQGTLDLSVPNGNVADPVSECGMDIFDYDEEGYGNPRIERVIDVGADEQGQMIIAGYIPMTTSFGTDATGTIYDIGTIYHLPDPNPGSPLTTRTFFGRTTIQDRSTLPSTTPGVRANGTIAKYVMSIGTLWIDRTTFAFVDTSNGTLFGGWSQFTVPIGTHQQWNAQEMTRGMDGYSPLSNLQSFRTTP
ncbi:MAG: DUF1565 domain-containing protein [Phycisphaerae bacterium]|nr:DUF1565 domain-containing protein [Phycisphaerae bacterium]